MLRYSQRLTAPPLLNASVDGQGAACPVPRNEHAHPDRCPCRRIGSTPCRMREHRTVDVRTLLDMPMLVRYASLMQPDACTPCPAGCSHLRGGLPVCGTTERWEISTLMPTRVLFLQFRQCGCRPAPWRCGTGGAADNRQRRRTEIRCRYEDYDEDPVGGKHESAVPVFGFSMS